MIFYVLDCRVKTFIAKIYSNDTEFFYESTCSTFFIEMNTCSPSKSSIYRNAVYFLFSN